MGVFRALYRRWGPQRWWPGETPFEVVVGAILTQNTAWANVERAIARLRERGLLTPRRMGAAGEDELAEAIRPSGYYHVKARRLRAFLDMLAAACGGDLARLWDEPTPALRERLLGVAGVGPETADSILLYAAGRPVFVVDAYTRRFLRRHGWATGRETYAETARLFQAHLARDSALFNEYHALIVRLGKEYCRPRPRCGDCPLQPWLSGGGPRGDA